MLGLIKIDYLLSLFEFKKYCQTEFSPIEYFYVAHTLFENVQLLNS